MSAGGEALERAALAGIHQISLPTPFAIGAVNCYLIEDEPLTLVDTGPNSGTALNHLAAALAARGHSIADLGLIVLTHNHMDHRGLVEVLVQRSGATVAAYGPGAERLANFEVEYERDDEFSARLMSDSGVPEDVIAALRGVSSSYMGWGSPVEVTMALADGDTVELRDRSLQVLFRPGHSPMDCVFWDAERELAIVGDHLLGHVSSNPTVTRPLDGSAGRSRSLVSYLDSLRKTRKLPAKALLLSGHGEPIEGHRTLIDERTAATARRKEKMRRLLRERPLTGHEIAQAVWGPIAVTQAFLTLSEVFGHMDLLGDEGRVREIEDDGVIRFEAV